MRYLLYIEPGFPESCVGEIKDKMIRRSIDQFIEIRGKYSKFEDVMRSNQIILCLNNKEEKLDPKVVMLVHKALSFRKPILACYPEFLSQ